MKILVISDTHGNHAGLKKIMADKPAFDRVIHLGDSSGDKDKIESIVGAPVDIVRGNCDMFTDYDDNLLLKIGRHNCLLTHGHLYGAKSGNHGLVMAAKEIGADYVIFGHIHNPMLMEQDGVFLVNPGSLTYPRDGRRSYMVMDVDNEGEIHLSINYLQ